jgi:hypothetical protein
MQSATQASPYLPLFASVLVAVVTAASTLVGVLIAQRSARQSQRIQTEAAALLDREQREHQERLEREKREYETSRAMWQQRCEIYGELISLADEITDATFVHHGPDVVLNKTSQFWSTTYRALIVAPESTAKAVVLLSERARRLILTLDKPKERERTLEQFRDAKRLFLEQARLDLGTGSDVLGSRRVTPREELGPSTQS